MVKTEEEIKEIIMLVNDLREQLGIEGKDVKGHIEATHTIQILKWVLE